MLNRLTNNNMKKTLENLVRAFIGESQARNRYTFYASRARKEGYEQISEIFLITADNERQHAKTIFQHINELKENSDNIKVEAEAPTVLGTTLENLKAAAQGEKQEYSQMYPEFAKTAEEEGLQNIAQRLRSISKAEEHHEQRYKKLIANLENNKVFVKDQEVAWVCRECGYVHYGKEAPEKCPSCDHERSFYQLQCEEY